MMISLLIETSTERGCIALMRGTEVIYHKELPFGLTNSQHLLPEIDLAFKASAITPQDLEFVTAGIGPGSYTGIRVGVMTAKALAYALKIPLVGISTLEGFVPAQVGLYCAIIDAKIGGVYLLKGEKTQQGIELSSQPQICELNQLETVLGEGMQFLVTPNSAIIKPKIEGLFGQKWLWIDSGPDPVQMTRSALAKVKAGDVSLDGRMELLYLRKTQAEIEKERRVS